VGPCVTCQLFLLLVILSTHSFKCSISISFSPRSHPFLLSPFSFFLTFLTFPPLSSFLSILLFPLPFSHTHHAHSLFTLLSHSSPSHSLSISLFTLFSLFLSLSHSTGDGAMLCCGGVPYGGFHGGVVVLWWCGGAPTTCNGAVVLVWPQFVQI